MTLDSTGRPIPIHTPAPPNHQPRMSAEQEQFVLSAKKIDDALSQIEDLSRRVLVLEKTGEETLHARLVDFERRFDAMMLERLTEFEKRFDLMAQAAARPPTPAAPAPESATS